MKGVENNNHPYNTALANQEKMDPVNNRHYDHVLAEQEKLDILEDKTNFLRDSTIDFKAAGRKVKKDASYKATAKAVVKSAAKDATPKSRFKAFKKALLK